MPLPADNNLLSVSKASSLLEVSSDTLRRLDKKGQVTPKRGPNSERLYSADDISLLKQVLKKPVGERSYGIQEAANILRVSPQTIRRWEREGKIATSRTPGGTRFFTLKDIQVLQNLPKTVQTQAPVPVPQIPVPTPQIHTTAPQIPTPIPQTLAPVEKPTEIISPVLPFPMPGFGTSIPKKIEEPAYQSVHLEDSKPFVVKKRKNYVPYIIIIILILLLGSTVAYISRQTYLKSTASNSIEANLPIPSPAATPSTNIISNVFKLGSIIFQGADNQFAEDNNNLFWDGPNAFLGIGTNLPNARLTVSGGVTGVSLVELIGQDSNNILSATSNGQQVFNIDHAGNTQIAGALSDINDSSLNVLQNLAVGGDLTVAGGDITSSNDLRIYSTKSTTLGSSSSPTTINGKDITISSANNVYFKNSVLTNSIKLSNTATALPNGNTGIVDAIVDAWNHGGSGGTDEWSSAASVVYPNSTTDNLAIGGTTAAAPFYVTASSGNITSAGIVSAVSFKQNGNLVCDSAGTNCPAGAVNYWEQAAGTLYPLNSTVDVLIGASSTASAKFAFKNVLTGTPTASISGTTTGVATYLTGNGNLAVTNMAHLTIGGGDTGGVDFGSPITSGTWNGSTIAANYGGTGFSSYTIGDLLYADSTSTLAKLADIATGNVLISGGVGFTPSWGKVTLGTHTTGNYVSTITGTANQITANTNIGDVTLSIPSDFRAPGTVNAVNGIYTGATAGTQRIDALGNLVNILNISASGYATISGSLALGSSSAVAGPGNLNMSGNLLVNGTITGTTIYQGVNQVCDAGGSIPGCGGTSSSYWEQAGGVLYPINNTVDVLIGASSTASAKFAFTGVNSGTPTASISGTTAGVATYLTGNGNLATTNMSHLTIGGAATGGVDFGSPITSGTWNGSTIAANYGGTGFSSYTVGDMLYADTTSTLAKLADVATGNVLISGGAGVAPSWNKVILGTHTTGNYVASISGTPNQITASNSIGDVTLSIPSDFRAPGTVNAVNGIYTGATAGTQRIDASGNLTNIGTTQLNGVTYTWPAAATANYVLQSTGTGTSSTLAWVDPAAAIASNIYWTQANGVLFPKNNSVDVLIGSDATTSAKFAFTGVNGGLPTASIAGNIAGVATYLTGDGNLAVTNMAHLILGGTTTGQVDVSNDLNLAIGKAYYINGVNVLNSNTLGTGVVTSSLTTVGALASGSIANGFGTITTANTITGTVINGTTGINTGAVAGTQRIDADGNLSANYATVAASLAIGSSVASPGPGNLDMSGNLLAGGNITGVVLNGTTGINTGAGAGTARIDSSGNLTAIGTTQLNGVTYTWPGTATANYVLQSTGTGASSTLTWVDPVGAIASVIPWFQGAGVLYPKNNTTDVLIGSDATTSAKFAFTGVNGGLPTASIAGNIAGVATYLTGDGNLATTNMQPLTIGGATTGNITLNPSNAAAGGFVVPNTTNVTDLGTSSLLWRNIYGTTIYQGVNQVCDAGGIGCPAGAMLWAQTAGAIYPVNNTVDLLIGSNATGSAKFAFKNVLTGTPTASISGTTAATFIDGNGNISTTNRQDLTLGNSAAYNTTGNILLNPNGTGNVGIGTTAPNVNFQVGAGTSSHSLTTNDSLFTADVEVDGNLYLDGGIIANALGTVTVLFPADPTAINSYNTLENGSWLVTNTVNPGIAALMVNQSKGGDIFTASASGIPKFTIANNGNITATGTLTGLTGLTSSGTINFSDLSASSAIYTDASKNLTSTVPTSGQLGYWTRTGTNLYNTNQGDNVGIGTTAPQSPLQVTAGGVPSTNGNMNTGVIISTSAGGPALNMGVVSNGNPGSYGWISSAYTNNAGVYQYLSLQPNGGNVGIGTTAPGRLFEVVGGAAGAETILAQLRSNFADVNTGTTLRFTNNTSATGAGGVGEISVKRTGTYGSQMVLRTATDGGGQTDRLTINMTGNVGIGTTNPSRGFLEIANIPASTFGILTSVDSGGRGLAIETTDYVNTTTGTSLRFTLGAATGNTYSQINSMNSGNTVGGNLVLQSSGGNVGIGTTAPASKLALTSTGTFAAAGISGLDVSAHTVTLSGANPTTYATFYANSLGAMTLVGTNASQTVTTASTLYVANPAAGANVTITNNRPINTASGAYLTSGGVWTGAPSYRRYKDNFTSTSNYLDKLANMDLYEWQYRNEVVDGVNRYLNDPQRHASPFLDDFYTVFGLSDDQGVNMQDLAGVALASVKELNTRFENFKTSEISKDLAMTNTGDLNITATDSGNYVLTDTASNSVIDRIGAFTDVVAANVKAGAIVTQEIATNSFMAFQGTIDNLLVKSGLVAANIQTKLISPLADGTDVTVQIGSTATPSGQFVIQNASGSAVATIDNSGNAAFSGNASISGTLYANEIKSKSLDEIQALLTSVQTDQNLLKDAANWNVLTATDSASLTAIATTDLYVTNQAAVNSLSVTNSLALGSDLVLGSAGNNIDSLSAPLRIQSLAMAPLEIMAGLVTIDTHGNVNIAGNLYVAGRIHSSGLTLQGTTLQGADATASASLLSLQNDQGAIVASIDASGSAIFTNIQTQKITGTDEDRGSVEFLPAEDSKVIQREWTSTPAAVLVSPSYKTQAWVTDTSENGFTVRVSDSPTDSAGKIFWWALW